MAMILTGKSTCPLCGEILKEGDELYATSAFLPSSHKFWKYSDAGFHKICIDTYDDGKELHHLFTRFLGEVSKINETKPKIPEGMTFSEFEETQAFNDWVEKLNFNIEEINS